MGNPNLEKVLEKLPEKEKEAVLAFMRKRELSNAPNTSKAHVLDSALKQQGVKNMGFFPIFNWDNNPEPERNYELVPGKRGF